MKVKAAELDVKARYEPIPFPLAFKGGEFVYDGDSITLRGVDVAIGNSKLFKHNATIGLNGNFPLESNSPKAVIDQSEILKLFRDYPPFNHLHRLDGILTFNNWQLKGQAFAPSTWMLVSAGTMQGLAVESELLPGLLSLPSGNFDWRGQTLRYEGATGSISRSEIKGLAVEADWTGPAKVQLRALELDASMADITKVMQSFPETSTYAAALSPMNGTTKLRDVRLQTRLLPEGPALDRFDAVVKESIISSKGIELSLTTTSGKIDWRGSTLKLKIAKASLGQSEVQNLSVFGDWGIEGAVELSADNALINCEEIFSRVLSLARLQSLRADVRAVQGTVTLSDVLFRGPSRDSDRWRIKATGDLKDIEITTTFLDGPVRLPSGRLTAADIQAGENVAAVFHLDAIRLSHAPHTVTISGEIRLSPSETHLDLDVAAADLDWGEMVQISDRIAKYQQGESRPVRGRIEMRSESFQYERFRAKPLHALATFDGHGTTVLIERAGFCGMTLIGRIAFEESMVDAYLVPVVNSLPIHDVMACLTSESHLTSGNFNLDGFIQVRARREELINALSGRLNLVAEDGTILKSVLFARLFSILNLTEIYRGHFPDFKNQGLDFKRSKATIEIKDGKVVFHDWSIDGRTLWMGSRGEIDIATQKIDFTIMVSPFKTIDRIINSIPGIRWILGGRLVAIPMKATGELENPNIVALSPAAVGTSLLEMFQRTLALPIEIIQPLVPGMESQEGATITR